MASPGTQRRMLAACSLGQAEAEPEVAGLVKRC